MHSSALKVILAFLAASPLCNAAQPTVHLSNGTYLGVHNEQYDQDFFLGMPYAKAPTGSRRFAAPEPLDETFDEPRSATEYSLMCIGYGSDTAALGNPVSEDCLTINVVRPAGTKEGDDLPVGIWVHGGSYVNGGSRDPRYNLSWIVDQSVSQGTPMIGVSINYRLSLWGFLFSKEMEEAGAGNIGFKDQRLALKWLQDNIAAFGGSSKKVTVWGESAGARSLGMQLIAYDGKHDGLFNGAILQSGSSVAIFAEADDWQPYFDALVAKTGCDDASDKIGCLRELPVKTLSDIFSGATPLNATAPALSAVVDHDFMTAQASELLGAGKFAKVPLLLGNNFDEGTGYAKKGINTDAEFTTWLSSFGFNKIQTTLISLLYPDDPSVGIPAFYKGRPTDSSFGSQFKRVSAFAGDFQQHAGRRLLAETYAKAGLAVYSYLWNVHVNGLPDPIYGATHFQEVAFVFNNIKGEGYAASPFKNKPESFVALADKMNKMWVAFINNGNPNIKSCKTGAWPQYTARRPYNLVFDANVTDLHYVERDNYRGSQIVSLLDKIFP